MRNSFNHLEVFLEVTKIFNKSLSSVPVLYGSLGLAQLLNDPLNPTDIDLLIEQQIFETNLNYLPKLMAEIEFKPTDLAEQEYIRKSSKVGIASDGDLLKFAGIDPKKLTVLDTPCSYRVLSLQDYLSVYEASSVDGYRKDVRAKDDTRKLALIHKELRKT